MALDNKSLRSLVSLLDDEDPQSLALVHARLREAGEAVLPYLDEARDQAPPELAKRCLQFADEMRFEDLRRRFLTLARERVLDLETGALLVSRFGHPQVDPAVYGDWLDKVAAAANEDIPRDAPIADCIRRLASHLFIGMGFGANDSNYYDPENSFLSRVIDARRGIPITLSVLFLLLAKRLRIPAYGVGAPGHFLVGFRDRGDEFFLDAYRQGRIIDKSEARRMILRNGYEFRPSFLRPCPPREILTRMMRNLLSIYQKTGSTEKAERLSELVVIVVTGQDVPGPEKS